MNKTVVIAFLIISSIAFLLIQSKPLNSINEANDSILDTNQTVISNSTNQILNQSINASSEPYYMYQPIDVFDSNFKDTAVSYVKLSLNKLYPSCNMNNCSQGKDPAFSFVSTRSTSDNILYYQITCFSQGTAYATGRVNPSTGKVDNLTCKNRESFVIQI